MTMRVGEASQPARVALAERLRSKGVIRSHAIFEAFASVPREAFVPFFFREQGHGWQCCTPADLSPKEWHEALYADDSLVVSISDRNAPTSASSAPTVMARMLEALQVESGMRVLEIGTGTGYNAALLATLTGNPARVTSVEVDARLAYQAYQALQQTVGEVDVRVSDGMLGAPGENGASFDRIIATASSRTFPWAWYQQLAPGGRLVMDLQGGLNVSSFCVLEKTVDGEGALGSFDVPPLYFMPMREQMGVVSPDASWTLNTWTLSSDHPLPARLLSDPFRWFVQWYLPGLVGKKGAIHHPRTGKRVEFLRFRNAVGIQLDLEQQAGKDWRVQCLGPSTLWEQMEVASVRWDELGQPVQQAYRLEIKHEQAAFLVSNTHLPLLSFS
ncbi:MAG TPA: methyltransferase domain-containing protein [Ktedonobacteraceae bacterium]|nr:methyltransferase domain-containing protein [Ktedonobacteraceae bacterium]